MQNYDELSLITALVTAIIVLTAVIRFLYLENKSLNTKISKIYESHKNDLKEAGKDVILLTDKFQTIISRLKSIIDD